MLIDMPCVIFAGGRSSRMGEDKALLPFSTYSTLTEFQYTRLNKIFSKVYISCKNRDKFSFDALFIEDIQKDSLYAPTAGFISIFKTISKNSFFVISVDSPFISRHEIKKLIESDSSNFDATVAKTSQGIQPMCGIYHQSLSQSFQTMFKEKSHKLGFLLKNSKTNFVYFKDEKPFLNLNYKHEYQEALTLI